MDRFIVLLIHKTNTTTKDLKSNMDRFIGKSTFGVDSYDISFKIQYG